MRKRKTETIAGTPTRDELLECVRSLLDWNSSMGGWEASVWTDARRLSVLAAGASPDDNDDNEDLHNENLYIEPEE